MRNGEQARDEMVNDMIGQILLDGVEVRMRWAEFFEQVLNVDWRTYPSIYGLAWYMYSAPV